jgi:hypothetical protein
MVLGPQAGGELASSLGLDALFDSLMALAVSCEGPVRT